VDALRTLRKMSSVALHLGVNDSMQHAGAGNMQLFIVLQNRVTNVAESRGFESRRDH
jgi:hypothetical protein